MSGSVTTPGTPTTLGTPTGVKQAAEQAVAQTRELTSDAKQHLGSMVQRTRGELRQQAAQRGRQVSEGLDSLERQIRGLRNGQPDRAGSLEHCLAAAEQRLSSWARRLERSGPDLVLADVGIVGMAGTSDTIGAGGEQVQQGLSSSGMPASVSGAGVVR